MENSKGLIHVYTGDGKGKTTASIGLCVRAVGAGKRVAFTQFMKGRQSSEIAPLGSLGVEVIKAPSLTKFTFAMNEAERSENAAGQMDGFDQAISLAPQLDVLVLDEIISAVTTGMIAEERLLDFLRNKPQGLEVILTGRDVPASIAALADYLSEIRAVKHPYEQGIPARLGIEM